MGDYIMLCALDFEYDKQYLRDFGFIIGKFGSPSNIEIVSIGSGITFNTVPIHNGKRHTLTSVQYDECIQVTFQICKNPKLYNDLKISEKEYTKLVRWLNRKEFLKFRIINDDLNYRPIFYYGSFNIKKVLFNDELYGLELSLTTDSPFGYGDTRILRLKFSEDDVSNQVQKSVIDSSDEIGYIYPKTIIKIPTGVSGDLEIRNHSIYATDNNPRTTSIENCLAGEIIEIDNENQIITSNYSSPVIDESEIYHDICDDFNYKFFALTNKLNDRVNKISVSLPCEIEIRYNPIIKNSPL